MSIYVDSSVLIRALIKGHTQHQPSATWYDAMLRRTELVISTHALAELHNHMTGTYKMPLDYSAFIERSLQQHVRMVSLSIADYNEAIRIGNAHGFTGAMIYDVLHYQAYLKAECAHLAAIDKGTFPRLFSHAPAKLIDPNQT